MNKYPPMVSGQRYGRLLSVERAGSASSGNALWKFICDCDTESIARSVDVQRGFKRSCGCLDRETAAANGRAASLTHGTFGTPEHNSWAQMIQRCRNPQAQAFKNYGGRGIKVCERWEKFENFYADMGPRPSPEHSIDRINNDGDYESSNCRWATRKEQARNQRSNRVVAFGGKEMALSEFCEVSKVKRSSAKYYLNRGLTADEITERHQ